MAKKYVPCLSSTQSSFNSPRANGRTPAPQILTTSPTVQQSTTLTEIRSCVLASTIHAARSFTGVVFALHLLGLSLIFQSIGGVFDANPLIDQDWGLHFHHLKSLEAFWTRDRILSGYNP